MLYPTRFHSMWISFAEPQFVQTEKRLKGREGLIKTDAVMQKAARVWEFLQTAEASQSYQVKSSLRYRNAVCAKNGRLCHLPQPVSRQSTLKAQSTWHPSSKSESCHGSITLRIFAISCVCLFLCSFNIPAYPYQVDTASVCTKTGALGPRPTQMTTQVGNTLGFHK